MMKYDSTRARTCFSQDYRANSLIFEGVAKNILKNSNLRELHLLNQKMTNRAWGLIGNAIGENKSLLSVSINISNLNTQKAMNAFMKGFEKNDSVEILDLADNEISDDAGVCVLNMIKAQSEKRDS